MYAALAGFGIPTVRALLMLFTAMIAISFSRQIHPGRAWLLALAGLLLIDPFASLRAGFWFSFTAVAALLITFVPRNGRHNWWRSLLLAQAAVTLALLPVSAAWFQAVSLVSFAANLLAIPLVSLTIVPLVLAGVVAGAVHGQLAGLLWSVAGDLSGLLLAVLELFAQLQGELMSVVALSPIATVLALLGAGLLLLPRGLPIRWCGLFLLCPLFLPPASRLTAGAMELEILDVGQGTAVLLRAAGKTLLYDSGPGDGAGRDRVSSVIVPALSLTPAGAPDRVIISHGDRDHAGGLWSLQARYPQVPVLANLSRHQPGSGECHAPFLWRWGETEFEVLHPSAALPYRGNDSSCVIEARRPGSRILLSGDISAVVEARLLLEGLQQSDVLVVPHHGSRTSSSPAFIAAVQPRVAVATASLGNRFGFPRGDVRRRYERAGVLFWSTGECGALRVQLGDEGELTAASARLERPAIWRWPADQSCPGNGVP
jgi:competence protein ComEC